jgi:hypothetical protein
MSWCVAFLLTFFTALTFFSLRNLLGIRLIQLRPTVLFQPTSTYQSDFGFHLPDVNSPPREVSHHSIRRDNFYLTQWCGSVASSLDELLWKKPMAQSRSLPALSPLPSFSALDLQSSPPSSSPQNLLRNPTRNKVWLKLSGLPDRKIG